MAFVSNLDFTTALLLLHFMQKKLGLSDVGMGSYLGLLHVTLSLLHLLLIHTLIMLMALPFRNFNVNFHGAYGLLLPQHRVFARDHTRPSSGQSVLSYLYITQ